MVGENHKIMFFITYSIFLNSKLFKNGFRFALSSITEKLWPFGEFPILFFNELFCNLFFPREIRVGLHGEEGGRVDEAGVLFDFSVFFQILPKHTDFFILEQNLELALYYNVTKLYKKETNIYAATAKIDCCARLSTQPVGMVMVNHVKKK